MDTEPIQVERSKALHELVESRKHEEVSSKDDEEQSKQLNTAHSSTPAYVNIQIICKFERLCQIIVI